MPQLHPPIHVATKPAHGSRGRFAPTSLATAQPAPPTPSLPIADVLGIGIDDGAPSRGHDRLGRAQAEKASITVAVVGAGVAGRAHASAFAADPRVLLSAIVDTNLARAIDFAGRFGAATATRDYDDVLRSNSVDVVSLCTPSTTHAQLTLAAVDAGKHVLCEKPIAVSLTQAESVCGAARARPDRTVSCVFQHRADPSLRRAKLMLGSEELGRVCAARVMARTHRSGTYYRGTRGTRAYDGGGAVLTQGIHLIDLIIWLLGDVEQVSARATTALHAIEAEDTLCGWLELRSGVPVTLECTACAPHDEYCTEILTQNGNLRLTFRPGWARTWKLEFDPAPRRRARRIGQAARRAVPMRRPPRVVRVGSLVAGRVACGADAGERHRGHRVFIEDFVACILAGRPNPAPAADAARSVAVVDSLYESASQGVSVSVPYNFHLAR